MENCLAKQLQCLTQVLDLLQLLVILRFYPYPFLEMKIFDFSKIGTNVVLLVFFFCPINIMTLDLWQLIPK
jgi:hypothetical protein